MGPRLPVPLARRQERIRHRLAWPRRPGRRQRRRRRHHQLRRTATMQFDVRALSSEAVLAQLAIDATDEADARRQVEARGMVVASIAARRGALDAAIGRRAAAGMPLVLFSQELLALLSAG